MSDFLKTMERGSRARADRARREIGEQALLDRAKARRHPAREPALHPAGFDLIAEIKRASPSAGALAAEGASIERQADAYARAGAAIISVLTEPSSFDGSLDDLETLSPIVRTPLMRKDFLVDPIQVLESRAAGASGVLLISRMLSKDLLAEMIGAAGELDMFVLLEAFSEADLPGVHEAVAIGSTRTAMMVGVNTRDLTSLKVELPRLEVLHHLLPPGLPHVAESGLKTAEDVQFAVQLGYDLALIGSSLMAADEPDRTTARLIEAGRQEAMRACM